MKTLYGSAVGCSCGNNSWKLILYYIILYVYFTIILTRKTGQHLKCTPIVHHTCLNITSTRTYIVFVRKRKWNKLDFYVLTRFKNELRNQVPTYNNI